MQKTPWKTKAKTMAKLPEGGNFGHHILLRGKLPVKSHLYCDVREKTFCLQQLRHPRDMPSRYDERFWLLCILRLSSQGFTQINQWVSHLFAPGDKNLFVDYCREYHRRERTACCASRPVSSWGIVCQDGPMVIWCWTELQKKTSLMDVGHCPEAQCPSSPGP